MKAIITKYHGPGNVRGSRYSASDEDGNKVIVPKDYSINAEENHREAARRLCVKMGWEGDLQGGSVKGGMVWVFNGSDDVLSVVKMRPKVVPGVGLRMGPA